MHVARNRRAYTAKSGEQRVYESVLVRRTYRDGSKVRHETLANLSALPAEAVSAAFPGYLPYGGVYDDVRPHLTVGDRPPGGVTDLRAAEADVLRWLPIQARISRV